MAEQQQDVEALKRRGRRRLVGAVALVLAAVIVLPMVFDPEPRPTVPPVSVRIPGEDEAPFKPRAPEKKALPQKKSPDSERARAEAALAGAEYIVPVGAFTNPDGVIAKLTAAKMPYYTETPKDKLTRVRAGPFSTKEAAEKALEKLKGLGLQPGSVTAKSG
jgi:DedD protein